MRLVVLVAAAVLLAPSVGLAQITAGQVDDFESGLQGWSLGPVGSNPGLEPNGGPASSAQLR